MSRVIRSVKNVTKGYSSTQIKVRNATSNDPWGPTGTEMSEIARMTFDTAHDFFEIMDMLDRRLNDKGKNWRHVLKALKVLDYCLHEGSENVVVWAKDNIYVIKTLREFQYMDEDGRDQGLSVRVAAKELTALIQDEERLRNERKDRKLWKSRVNPIDDFGSNLSVGHRRRSSEGTSRKQPRRPSGGHRSKSDEEDTEYRLAIEASKHSAEEEKKRQANRANEMDADLEKAIKLSKEEEELRQRELERSNADALFDDAFSQAQPQQQQQQQQQLAFQQPVPQFQQDYQQLGAVDFFGNPINAPYQQSLTTGYLDNVYSQPSQFGQQFPQPTGFDQAFQPSTIQQPTSLDQQSIYNPVRVTQPTSFNSANPYSNNFSQPASGLLQPGLNNPYANNGQQAESLKPMPTGSNNPFAQLANRPQSPAKSVTPSLSMLQQQQQKQQQPQFSAQNTVFSPPQTTLPIPNQPANAQHARLEALLAAGGDGLDTFGNVGNLRIPAQHTAPGTFVNSAGHGRDRAQVNPTGTNPFLTSQFTSTSQSVGFGSSPSLQVPTGNKLMPSYTGPAGMNTNGIGYGQQQQQQAQAPYGFAAQQHNQSQPTTGTLIDL